MATHSSGDAVERPSRRTTRQQSTGKKSSSKKSRLEAERTLGDSGDEMDVQISDFDMNKNKEMDVEEDYNHPQQQEHISHHRYQPKVHGKRDSMSPYVSLGDRCHLPANTDKDLMKPKEVKSSTTAPAMPIKPLDSDVHVPKSTTMAEYRKEMEAKAVNHRDVPSGYTPSGKAYTVRQRATNIPSQKENVQQHKKQEVKKTRAVARKPSAGDSSKGFLQYFCWLVVLLLLSSAALFVYKNKMKSQSSAGRPSRSVSLETFAEHLSRLEARFHNQRPELWARSRIHLEKHLRASQPTEPVSLILTSGRRAEKTLSCLAKSLASAFSSAVQGSVLHIDGASKAGLESDAVKLDIDRQLQAAFGGSQPVAVMHRLEELPPGATLIFYRYCDHETAAFKEAFLLFTILLPQDEVRGELEIVEESVQDYLKDRLVGSGDHTSFNDMDADKYGGLWSRISHVVLPVVAEKDVEQNGC
ncbi:torsin-1A-interacting protein 2 isoform X2 [Nerophis lumbriciformis]|uniref:torsin-1A-interacting protein 2 isoform X2 n=1 Tax=Nerophis lumbriciformis TaxID=546530 RepID=UPI002AE010F0|nr:torsin-1A-interacting protein 2-like isoform X2 [Nerophis lumbriciformis]